MIRSEVSPSWEKRLARLSTLLILLYVIRITILARWLNPIAPYVVNYGGYAILIISLLVLFRISKRMQPNEVIILTLILIAVSVFFSDYFEFSLIRTILWILVFMVAGPFFTGVRVALFRDFLWEHFKTTVFFITVLSFAWYVFRLPLYGKGMAGVTVHCMLLGAIAGLSMILAFTKAIQFRKSYVYWGIFFVSFLVCLLAASRASILAGTAGCLTVLVFQARKQANQLFLLCGIIILSLFVWVFFDLGNPDVQLSFSSGQLHEYTKELASKGFANTRERLWDNRLAEFENNPFFGVGIGVDTFAITREKFGVTAVEPGSSYLTILSMTGIFGAIGMLILFANLGSRFLSRLPFLTTIERTQIFGIGTFWAIHAVAEGWIFAGGSILCLFFWIWVGQLARLGTTFPTMSKS